MRRCGAATFSIMTFNMMTLSIKCLFATLSITRLCHYAECRILLLRLGRVSLCWMPLFWVSWYRWFWWSVWNMFRFAGSEPGSCLCQVFNSKLVSFAIQRGEFTSYIQPMLELKPPPRFRPFSSSLSMDLTKSSAYEHYYAIRLLTCFLLAQWCDIIP
jgi:hypothetical protein